MSLHPTYLIIHHSAGPRKQTTEQIRDYHMRTVEEGGRGWDEIGYHRILEQNGSVHQGRPDDQAGAHAIGYNSKSLGVCVVGNFDEYPLEFNHPQWKALVQTCAVLCKRYKIPAKNILYHRDTYLLRGVPVEKSCPGKQFPVSRLLQGSVAPYLKGKLK